MKIDKTFVQRARHNARDEAIVRAAVDLGHTLGLRIVAEGIEDAETARLMVASGSDLLQGYPFLPPVPAAEITEWSAADPSSWTGAPSPDPVLLGAPS